MLTLAKQLRKTTKALKENQKEIFKYQDQVAFKNVIYSVLFPILGFELSHPVTT